MAGSKEITIVMSSTEEDIRKLYDASKIGSVQILNTLLHEDPNLIQKLSTISTSNIGSPLHVSVSHDHLEFTRALLYHSPELAGEVDVFQRTPLHLAAKKGYTNIVQVLLEKNTSACLVHDKKGLIPLHYAMIKGHIEVIQELIKARPQSIWMKLESGQTILHLCVEGNHLEELKFLTEMVAKHDKDFLNTIDGAGNTILDMSMNLRQIEMVRYLLSISEVKTGRTITSRKRSLESKKKMPKKSRRKGQEVASLATKKKGGCWNIFKNKVKYKGDWAQEVQAIMMLVATVIATVTFQGGINPPGGVWQQDTPYNSTNHHELYDYQGFENGSNFAAGTSILAYRRKSNYSAYLIANSMSFMASVSVIMLIISRLPQKNKICSSSLGLAMFLAVFSLTLGYIFAIRMVSPIQLPQITPTIVAYFICVGVVLLIGLWYFIRFLVWVVKSLWRVFSSMLKSQCFNIIIPSTRS